MNDGLVFNEFTLMFDILIVDDKLDILSDTCTDIQSQEFKDFERSMMFICQSRGFDEDNRYCVTNSSSKHYRFTKIQNSNKLRLIFNIRSSDHESADKEVWEHIATSDDLSVWKQYPERCILCNSTSNIMVDGNHLFSDYEQSLRYIEQKIDRFDAAFDN